MEENEQPASADPGSGFGGLRHRMRYGLDNLLARGTSAVLIWLGAVTLAVVLLSSLLLAIAGVTLSGSEGGSFLEGFWQSLLRTMDPGTMAGDGGWGPRLLALAVTVFGILVAGTLIGVIASGVEARIDRMRRGRSVVIESDHVVILGASERLPIVVEQLVIAHRKRGGRTIVVLADRDPSEMVDEVGAVVEDSFGSRIVYRCGDPAARRDLELVRLQTARTVIVLSGADADVGVVKTVLAIGAELGGFHRVPIVAEVSDLAVAGKLERACGPMIHPILASQASARTAALALREPGISQVVDELFDFRECDLYVRDDASLVGLSFGTVVGRYVRARPIGRVRPNGEIELNPPHATVFETGDRLAVLAQDRGRLEVDPTPTPVTDPSTARELAGADTVGPEHLLVLGWSDFGPEFLSHWGNYSNPSSTVDVAVDDSRCGQVATEIASLGVAESCSVITDDPMDRLFRPAGRPSIDTVVFLGDHRLDRTEADMRVLLDLAALRAEYPGAVTPRLVVELRDAQSLTLVDLPGADDYVVSDATASKFIAQLAEQPERRRVFLELYDPTSSTLRIDEVDELGLVGEFDVRDLWSAAYDMGLIAIGWRRSVERGGEFVLNAPATDRIELRPGDQLVSVG